MKLLHLLVILFADYLTLSGQNIGIGTTTPHASAALEIKESNKGLLMPRTSTVSRTGIVNPAKGLMLYDSTTGSFWYHSGAAWVQLASKVNSWSTTGNAGTNNAQHFLGTTDKRSLQFKVNNIYSGAIDTLGNVFMGPNAGVLNASFNSVAIGNGAFKTAAGGEMVAIGVNSLGSNINGIWNTALGSYTLASHKTGNSNTAVGYAAMDHDSAGAANTAVGAWALSANIKGFYNNAFGTTALYLNDSGNYNAAFGGGAMYSNTGGNENTAVGRRAMYFNRTGNANVAIGNWSLHQNIFINELIAIGDSAMFYNGTDAQNDIDGARNTAIGSKAMLLNTIGAGNTALGWWGLHSNTTGSSNTAVGVLALATNSGGSNNTAIGAGADVFSGGYTNATAIGAGAVVTASNSIKLGNGSVTNIYTNNNANLWVGSVYEKGYGIVRNNIGQQLKMVKVNVTVNSNINAFATIQVPFNYGETFGGAPAVYVANITGGPGGFAELIMTIAGVSTTGATLFVSNPRNFALVPNFQVNIVAIGAE